MWEIRALEQMPQRYQGVLVWRLGANAPSQLRFLRERSFVLESQFQALVVDKLLDLESVCVRADLELRDVLAYFLWPQQFFGESIGTVTLGLPRPQQFSLKTQRGR